MKIFHSVSSLLYKYLFSFFQAFIGYRKVSFEFALWNESPSSLRQSLDNTD